MVKFDFTKTPITQIADYIILAAAKMNSSDIHFDPREDGMIVRCRVDGELQNYTYIPKAYERNLSTRLKLLANMNITETRLPQDGAIKGKFGEVYLDMRVSSLPLNEGEKIVIRILDYSRSLEGLDKLGFNDKNLAKLKRMIRIPNGMILITGATGSGKSTTTYSILQTLNKEETNIITVEDPIEMNIEGLNQVQVNSEIGMTFAAALRSILRQDPNIILIGEIRDSETAQIAVRASITGHLVLSTIHTNNTLSTVERLLDMNVERYLLSSALTGIISQRLAKRVCKKCRIERETTEYEKKLLKLNLHKDIDKVWEANPEGCSECHNGYKGRIAIHEVLELDDEIRSALNNEDLKKEDIKKLVYTENVITMLQDALEKVVEGITTFEEVYKIIEIDDENSIFENMDKNKLNQEMNKTGAKKIATKLVVPTFQKLEKTPTQVENNNQVKTTVNTQVVSNNQTPTTETTEANKNIVQAQKPATEPIKTEPVVEVNNKQESTVPVTQPTNITIPVAVPQQVVTQPTTPATQIQQPTPVAVTQPVQPQPITTTVQAQKPVQQPVTQTTTSVATPQPVQPQVQQPVIAIPIVDKK